MKLKYLYILTFSLLFLASCNNEEEKEKNNSKFEITDKSKSIVGMVDGKIFSVPSPYEFILFIKKLEIPYNHALLNPAGNRVLYESDFKKCLNFGVYGIDLAYLTVFEQSSTALNYFATIKALSEDIDLTSIFDANTIERLENNMETQDSLLIILTKTYREADKSLKNDRQKNEAALIVAGSWIESLYLLTQIQKVKPSNLIVQKIAEHKYYAENVLALLRPYYNNSDDYKKIIDAIVHICYQFDGITVNYTYKAPITYPNLHKTVLMSETHMDIYSQHLKNITELIEKLRTSIIK